MTPITDEIRVLSTTAILGYGFPEASFREGMKRKPHVIAADAGSTDPGPYYLGAGVSFTDRNSVKRDLEIMIQAGVENKIPVVVGSAGGSGANAHVDWVLEIVREIIADKKLSLRLAVIRSEFDKETILREFDKGHITPLAPAPEATKKDIEESVRIVAQMGEEPFVEALKGGADVIIAGRSYDPSVFACLPIKEGFDRALALHMGKILECAAICALPGSGSDCMFGYLRKDHFVLEPLSKDRKCTTLSVAGHTLYEKTDPYHLSGPGGALDLHGCHFEQIDDNKVKISGTVFEPTDGYFLKLEGTRLVGYRTISVAATTDPIMISKIDSIIESVKARVKDNFDNYGIKDYYLDFKIYGKNGVMSMFEGIDGHIGSELMVVIEAVAKTQKEADTICSFARSTMLHFGYEGRIATAGNLAFPFSPSDCHMGEVYEFSLYHLLKAEDPTQYFPVEYIEYADGQRK